MPKASQKRRAASPASATSKSEKASQESTGSEILQDLRQKARKSLLKSKRSKSQSSDDLDFLVNSVKALIGMNTEIWDVCQAQGLFKHTAENIRMAKFCYEEAVAKKPAQQKLTVTTRLKMVAKNFGKVPHMPIALTNIITLDNAESAVLPRYDVYFEKAALLDDEVLVGFLNALKKHLEDIQVFLGKIEEWLREPQSTVDFLNELLKTRLAIPSADSDDGIKNVENHNQFSTKVDSSLCISCLTQQSLHQHKYNSRRNAYEYQCNNGVAKFYGSPDPSVLLSINESSGNAMDFTFDLTTKKGKEKLRSFVSFVKM